MRIRVFGILISNLNLNETFHFLFNYNYRIPHYVCLPDLSVLVKSQKDPKLKGILNNSLLTLPDGKFIEVFARLKGYRNVSTISGYWLIKGLLKTPLKHFFYGSSADSLDRIVANINRDFPEAVIAGYAAPPVLDLEEIEGNPIILKNIQEINNKKPDIIWIGISSPKQDYLISHFRQYIDQGVMIGVGGVFDYLAETKKISPEWIKKIGFRWLYRLTQEPGRLWKKYFFTLTGLISLLITRIRIKVLKLFKNGK